MLNLVSGSNSTPKQIGVNAQVSGQIMYTVPAGKRFKGFVTSNAGTTQAGITINGANVVVASASPVQLDLTAGTVIACSYSGAVALVGVEQ